MHKDAVYVREILRAGARGYLLKDSGEQDLINAVRALAKGEGYISPAVSDAVLTDYRKHVTDPIDLLTSRKKSMDPDGFAWSAVLSATGQPECFD
jgi:DNA-binding NarL/FixJ family response regulator